MTFNPMPCVKRLKCTVYVKNPFNISLACLYMACDKANFISSHVYYFILFFGGIHHLGWSLLYLWCLLCFSSWSCLYNFLLDVKRSMCFCMARLNLLRKIQGQNQSLEHFIFRTFFKSFRSATSLYVMSCYFF